MYPYTKYCGITEVEWLDPPMTGKILEDTDNMNLTVKLDSLVPWWLSAPLAHVDKFWKSEMPLCVCFLSLWASVSPLISKNIKTCLLLWLWICKYNTASNGPCSSTRSKAKIMQQTITPYVVLILPPSPPADFSTFLSEVPLFFLQTDLSLVFWHSQNCLRSTWQPVSQPVMHTALATSP